MASNRVVEIVPVRVVEIIPVRLAVVEIVPVLVVEMVPALVVEMVPVFANAVAETASTNVAAQTIVLRLLIALLLRFCKSEVMRRPGGFASQHFLQSDSLRNIDFGVVTCQRLCQN